MLGLVRHPQTPDFPTFSAVSEFSFIFLIDPPFVPPWGKFIFGDTPNPGREISLHPLFETGSPETPASLTLGLVRHPQNPGCSIFSAVSEF